MHNALSSGVCDEIVNLPLDILGRRRSPDGELELQGAFARILGQPSDVKTELRLARFDFASDIRGSGGISDGTFHRESLRPDGPKSVRQSAWRVKLADYAFCSISDPILLRKVTVSAPSVLLFCGSVA